MKYLFLLLITTQTMASNWMPKSKILLESSAAYQLEETCKNQSGEECFDVGNNPAKVYSEVILKADTQSCLDVEDCQAKFVLLVCSSGYSPIKNLDLLEVYCVKPTIQLDDTKFAAYQAELTLQAQVAAQKAALAAVKKVGECAEGVIDLVVLRNSLKQPALNTTQVKQFVATFAPIQQLLMARSLQSAKEEVQEIEPDGVLVTAGDKSAVITAIDACLGM